MGIAERKERQKKEVRESILQAAWRLVHEEGWQNLSVRKIADAIEYSVPVVYDHFENKEAILAEFSKQGFRSLADDLATARDKHRTASKQLEAIAYSYWDFAFHQKEYYQVMFGLGMPNCESLAKVPELIAFIGVLQGTIEKLLTESGKDVNNTWLKVHSFWSMIHGLVSINLVSPPTPHAGVSAEELNMIVLKDFIKGFLNGINE
jgi:AcrR family transcriptional regulator